MSVIPKKEQPALRDMFAMNIAGMLIGKSGIKINIDTHLLRKIDFATTSELKAIAFMAYAMADFLIEERVKKA